MKHLHIVLAITLIVINACVNSPASDIKDERSSVLPASNSSKHTIVQKKVDSVYAENDFGKLKPHFVLVNKDLRNLKAWVRKVAMGDDIRVPIAKTYMTKTCSSYVSDAIDVSLGYDGMMDFDSFKRKWGKKYDVEKASFTRLFETGNDSWASKKISDLTYLGELNGGDWFQFNLEGSTYENNYSEKIIRVVKVIQRVDKYLIDNFLSLSDL